MHIAVNLSARQLLQADFTDAVRDALNESGLPPARLELEITEIFMMENPDLPIGLLRELKKMGIKIAVDDFGSGYSSLAYLKQLPIDTLKIDRSFVMELPDNENDIAIVSTIISLAGSLGLDVVAEGVEASRQLCFLWEWGCRRIQGYLVSPPKPAAEIEIILQHWSAGIPGDVCPCFVCLKNNPH